MAEGTSSVTELREIAAKAKARVSEIKEDMQELATNGGGLIIGGAVSAGHGFVDQRFGKDMGDGVRQHYIGPAPSSLLVTGGVLGLTLFGAFGKASQIGWDVTKSSFNSYMNTMGRVGAVQLAARKKSDTKPETKPAANAQQATGTNG